MDLAQFPEPYLINMSFFCQAYIFGNGKFYNSIVYSLLKTTTNQKLPQRTIDPLDTHSHPQGVPPI